MANDAASRELRRQRFRLAEGVVASAQRHRGTAGYHLEIPGRGEFIYIGESEAVFLSLLNGERSFSESISLAARMLGARAPNEADAMQFCTRLLQSGLLVLQEGLDIRSSPAPSKSRRRLWNPFWMQLPILNPNRPLSAILPVCRWVFHPLATLLSCGLVVAALFVLWMNWPAFGEASGVIFARDNWIWLGVTWLTLKGVHEFSHALACKHYGGDVREMGLIFILFAPMAYVDVTSSWGLRSRWQRIHIAAAGMLMELTIAALATLVWSRVESPQLAHRLHNVIVSAGVTTLLFNLNPLMRFDGYYMLSDWLGLPNLAGRGASAVRQFLVRRVFGLHPGGPVETGTAGWMVFVYGVAAAAWKVVVMAGLILAAAVMFHGAGVILAATGVTLWMGVPLLQGIQWLRTVHRFDPIAVWRGLLVGGGCFGFAAFPLALLPNPRAATAPGVIDFAEARHVRTSVDGFVHAIHVSDGQHVESGTLLFELINEPLLNELRDVEIEMRESEVRRLAAVSSNELGMAQIEAALQLGLEQRLHERQQQVDHLQVRAPQSGYVIARRLHERLGTYVHEGDELCVLGDDAAKQVILAIDQSMLPKVAVGDRLTVRSSSGDAFTGSIVRLTPRARLVAPHPSLCAIHGGPLANRLADADDSDQSTPPLVEPVVEARLSLNPETAATLPAGQLCHATTRRLPESMGYALYRAAGEWIEDRIAAAESEARR